MNRNVSFPYEDILHLPYPRPSKRARMSMIERAAQFAPFAALTGFDSAITETARLTEQKAELDESEKARLDEALCSLSGVSGCQEVTVTYFVSDLRKEGGRYEQTTSCIQKVDTYHRRLVLTNGQSIALDDIRELKCAEE